MLPGLPAPQPPPEAPGYTSLYADGAELFRLPHRLPLWQVWVMFWTVVGVAIMWDIFF